MKLLVAISLPVLAIASPVDESALFVERQSPVVNATLEYAAQCKTCPWQLCTNVLTANQDEVVDLACWTEGDRVDDTKLWLKTTENCYIPEYDFIDSTVDYRDVIPYCGRVPLDITRQDATIRYLTTCVWRRAVGGGRVLHYGRDLDITLTCWAEAAEYDDVIGNPFWYKTTDNCHVPGANLWEQPNHDELDNCGAEPPPHLNLTLARFAVRNDDEAPATTLEELDQRDPEIDQRDAEIDQSHVESSLSRRWLHRTPVGEEYAPCYTCPTATTNSTCRVKKVYEFEDSVVTQCQTREEVTYPNGTYQTFFWALTTDWCYVESFYLWDPPRWFQRYSECHWWDGY